MRTALTAYLGGDGEMPLPGYKQMRSDGLEALYHAMSRHGGLDYWKLQFPVTEARKREERWQHPPDEAQGWFRGSYHAPVEINGASYWPRASRENVVRLLGTAWPHERRVRAERGEHIYAVRHGDAYDDYWAIESDARVYPYGKLPSNLRDFADGLLAEELQQTMPKSVWRQLGEGTQTQSVKKRGWSTRWVVGFYGSRDLVDGPPVHGQAWVVCFPLPRASS